MVGPRSAAAGRSLVAPPLGVTLLLLASVLAMAPSGADTGGPTGSGYVWVDRIGLGPPDVYDFEDISATGTALATTGGPHTVTFPASPPFTFRFFGSVHTSTKVAVTGFLSQVATGCFVSSTADTIKDNIAASCGSTFAPNCSGTAAELRHATLGTAPDRRFIVMWENFPTWSLASNGGASVPCGSHLNTFEVILYENSDIHEVHVKAMDPNYEYGCYGFYTGIRKDKNEFLEGYPPLNTCEVIANRGWRYFRNNATDAADQAVTAPAGTPTAFTLAVSDDPLKYTAVTLPAASCGSLSGFPAAGALTYRRPTPTFTSAAGFLGTCILSYTVHDGFSTPRSATVAFTVQETVPPSQVTGLAMTARTGTSIDLAWTAATDNVGVASYQVERNATVVASGVAATSHHDAPLAPATSYAYRVRAVDAAGNLGPWSGPLDAATLGPPPVLSSVWPDFGPTEGGTAVVLNGTGFVPGSTVRFDLIPAPVTYLSSTNLSVVAPPHAAGAADVTVRLPDGQEDVLPDGFAYVPGLPPASPNPSPSPSPSPSPGPSPSPSPGPTPGPSPSPSPSPGPSPSPSPGPSPSPPAGSPAPSPLPSPASNPSAPSGGSTAYTPPPALRADAGPDRTVRAGEEAELDGSGGDAGQAAALRWQQVAGPPAELGGTTGPLLLVRAPDVHGEAAELAFRLTLLDSRGATAMDEATVRVLPRDDRPVADAGRDQQVPGGATVELDGSASFDPQGSPLTYRWRQVGGAPVTWVTEGVPRPTFLAPAAGPEPTDILLQLTVGGGGRDSAPDAVRVRVEAAPAPPAPVAAIRSHQAEPGGLTVRLEAPDAGSPTAWTWRLGDGTTKEGRDVLHTYAAAGTYRVQADLSYADGTMASYAAEVTVGPPSPVDAAPHGEDGVRGGFPWLAAGAGSAAGLLAVGGLWTFRGRLLRLSRRAR